MNNTDMPETFEISLPVDTGAPVVARSAVAQVTTTPTDRRSDIALVVSELVTNAIAHGASSPGELTLAVQAWDRMIRIEVSAPGEFSLRETSDGFGLRIIAALADTWGILHGTRTTVWVEITY